MLSDKKSPARFLRFIGPIVAAYCVLGLLIESAVPHLIPENTVTARLGDSARAGAFVVWFYLIWHIASAVRGIYGPDSARYLEETPIWKILLEVMAAYAIASFCFAVLYTYIGRKNEGAFSATLTLGDALYFSIVTMTTTGYGDISPKLGLAKFFVCMQILFGFLYNVLFFSIFAGLAGRRR
jgi:hypothetical protein